jgi:diguanylate cyclase (GGDEF)-like protein/PAS domain S-box-containing protein
MSESDKTLGQLEQENEALSARLRLLEDALENMSHGLSMFDADARLVVHNRRYCDVVALSEEQVRPSMTYRELIELGLAAGNYPAGSDVDTIEREMWDNIASDDEARKVLKRGKRIYAINPRRTASGNLVATFEDITAKTQAEDALRDSETGLRAIIEAMPDCVKIFAADGTLTYINPQGLRLLQAETFEELQAWTEPVVPPEYLETAIDVHTRVIGGESVNWTYELIGLKGRRIHVEANAVPFRLPDGTRAHMSISRDVSARQKAENALRRSEERLRLVQDATGLADFDAGPNGIERCSARMIEQLGLPAGTTNVSEAEWLGLLHPDDRETWRTVARAALDPGTDVASAEFRIVRPDNGEVRWILSHTKAERNADGVAVILIGAHQDITERKRAEEALRASEARLSAILNAIPDSVKIYAEDGTLTYINPQGLEQLEAQSLEQVVASKQENIAPDQLAASGDVHSRVIGGETVKGTYEVIGLKGRRLHLEATAVPFRLPDGSRAHLCISRNVSERREAEDALRRSEERLRLVQEASGLADFESGLDGAATCSPRLAAQVGLPPGTTRLEFSDWIQIIHPDDRDKVFEGIVGAVDKLDSHASEFRIVRPDNGEVRWISSRTMIARDEHGAAVRSIGAHLDITDRKRADEALRESEERFRLAAEAASLGVWDYDPISGKREWSGRLCEIFGLDEDVEPSLELAAERVHPDDRVQFLELLHDMRDNSRATRFAFTFRVCRANDGAERWLTMNGWKADQTEGLRRIILTVRDVTEERTAEERIRWNASHDGLTQLANRSNFQEQLDNAVRKAKKAESTFGLLMIDLDHFKQINDALGHQAGDRLLQSFADRLRATVRTGDTVARLGGDEFAILVSDIASPARLGELSRSIHERLREPFIQQGRVLDCRVSIGAAIYPQHGSSPKDLLVSADMALRAAKAQGRSTTIEYRPHLRDEVQRFAAMVGTAREAISDDRVVPYYQPKLNLRDGSVVGFEALLRWRDKKKNCVHLPASIAAAFEDHEVAADISDRIISQSIADMRRWLEKDVPFGHVAVNASAAEFRRDDFAERVLESLHKADIPPHCFQLEVTETVFLGRGAEFVQRALQVLSKTGVEIALDDFGTGYASLRHLKEFPVDAVKIDRSFVRDMEDDPNDEAIINAVVNLGKNLGIKVVAEGIERMSQAERLIEIGCDYGQGFLFSEAIPGNRIAALVTDLAGRSKAKRRALKLASSRA